MTLYRKKPEIVEAIQIKQGMIVETTNRGTQYGNPGDYLVRFPNGELTVIRQHEFERLYEKIES